MRYDFPTFADLIGRTFRDPAGIAEDIVKLRLPHIVGWMALGLVTIATVILIAIERMIPNRPEMATGLGGSPFFDTVMLGALTVVFIFVLYYAGLAMGGKGTFGGTLLIMTWFQTIVLVLVAVQMLTLLLFPSIATVVSMLGFGLQLWCLMHFLNVLHDFNSLGKAAGLFALSIIGFAFGLGFILLMVGGAALIGGPI